MIVVADTSPLRYLAEIGCIDVLPKLYERVLIPPAVLQELSSSSTPPRAKLLSTHRPTWLEIRIPALEHPALEDLDIGEQEAISLAFELQSALLIDERMGRKRASELGLDHRGTLSVLIRAADEDLINLRQSFESLLQSGFRISPSLQEQMMQRIESYPKQK